MASIIVPTYILYFLVICSILLGDEAMLALSQEIAPGCPYRRVAIRTVSAIYNVTEKIARNFKRQPLFYLIDQRTSVFQDPSALLFAVECRVLQDHGTVLLR